MASRGPVGCELVPIAERGHRELDGRGASGVAMLDALENRFDPIAHREAAHRARAREPGISPSAGVKGADRRAHMDPPRAGVHVPVPADPCLPDMRRSASRYLGPDSRDFTAVLVR